MRVSRAQARLCGRAPRAHSRTIPPLRFSPNWARLGFIAKNFAIPPPGRATETDTNDMENQNSNEPKFLGMKRDALIVAGMIFAPNLAVWVVAVALFAVTNANLNRLNDTVANFAAQSAAQNEAQIAAIEAIHSDLRDIIDDVDALSAAFAELKTVFDQIHSRLDSIERHPPVNDSGDDGLDSLANPSE